MTKYGYFESEHTLVKIVDFGVKIPSKGFLKFWTCIYTRKNLIQMADLHWKKKVAWNWLKLIFDIVLDPRCILRLVRILKPCQKLNKTMLNVRHIEAKIWLFYIFYAIHLNRFNFFYLFFCNLMIHTSKPNFKLISIAVATFLYGRAYRVRKWFWGREGGGWRRRRGSETYCISAA